MRVGVYIDGFNLYYGGRDHAGSAGVAGWRWLDVRSLTAALVSEQSVSWPQAVRRIRVRLVYFERRLSPETAALVERQTRGGDFDGAFELGVLAAVAVGVGIAAGMLVAGRLARPAVRPVDLADLARSVATGFVPVAAERRVELVVDAAAAVRAAADPDRVTQVLANLLDNALRHTPAGGRSGSGSSGSRTRPC